MQPVDELHRRIESAIKDLEFPGDPQALYDAISYTLELGGKRIRPVLVLMGCDLFRGNLDEAMHAAVAAEVFHNFTLVHDDIMDKAPIRRGKESVYKKWDTNVAILAGDTMLARAYGSLQHLDDPHLKPVFKVFTQTAIDVCEGQQYDMDFENRETVTIDEYISMIRLKTAVLLGASLEMGALIADAADRDVENIREFGINLGIAFQLKDDYLDAFGDEKKFGKKTGNDIITNKKTFLYLKAFELATGSDRDRLLYAFVNATLEPEAKVSAVKEIYARLQIREHTEQAMDEYCRLALEKLDAVNADPARKNVLASLADKLMVRET